MRDRAGKPKLPYGAEAAFRIRVSCFGTAFSLYAAGAGRENGFCASLNELSHTPAHVAGPLSRGEWPTLLHLAERCGFWSLPEVGSIFIDSGDDCWLSVECREPVRYHRTVRYSRREWGLDALPRWAFRVSGLSARQPHFERGLLPSGNSLEA